MSGDGCALDDLYGRQPRNRWDERNLARLAAAQDGVVTVGQLAALGLTERARRRRVAQRRLVVLHRGVYAVGHGEVSERGRFRAAVWACGEGAALGHLAAARLLGLWERPVERIDVVVPAPRCPRAPRIRVHRSLSLTGHDVTHVRGIPCTSATRTLVDLARSPALEAVFERAERRGLIRPAELEALVQNRPGAARLRALLATHRPGTGATRSVLERRLLAGIRRARLPEPLVNRTLVLDALTLQPDLMWPAQRVLVELDGLDTHGTRTAMRRDRRRDRATILAGWVPLRFTWEDIEQQLTTVLTEIIAAHSA